MNKLNSINQALEDILEKIDSYVFSLVDLEDDNYTRLELSISDILTSFCDDIVNGRVDV
jgi:hypothetical protein